MPEGRPEIPAQLTRDVLVEAGHRCAVPRCGVTITVRAHIIDWARIKEHTFDNLIALCNNCHELHTRRIIDTKALRQYKANLSIVNGRYGSFERRVLQYFADRPGVRELHVHGDRELDLMWLVRDGLLRVANTFGMAIGEDGSMWFESTVPFTGEGANLPRVERRVKLEKYSQTIYELTDEGVDFVAKWLRADDLAQFGEGGP